MEHKLTLHILLSKQSVETLQSEKKIQISLKLIESCTYSRYLAQKLTQLQKAIRKNPFKQCNSMKSMILINVVSLYEGSSWLLIYMPITK